MSRTVESFTYEFEVAKLKAYRSNPYSPTSWYLICPTCEKERRIQRLGVRMWYTVCADCHCEYWIEPRKFYVVKPVKDDFSKIMGVL